MAKRRKERALPRSEASNAAGSDAIAKIAYDLWLIRGCLDGSPEEDWYEAERILKSSADSMEESTVREIATEPPSHSAKTISAAA
jgi:hypothetical protein